MLELVSTPISTLELQRQELINFFKPRLGGKRVHFFDVPVHTNTGDSLIFTGTLKLLKDVNADVVSWCSIYHRNVLKSIARSSKVKPGDVIICQGGGNFGDIYERHQSLRKRVVELYPNNQIILFPQSMHFNSDESLKADLSFFSQAKNFSICVRDEFSFNTLRENGLENSFLVPDIATCLVGHVKASSSPISNTKLNFLRADVESATNTSSKAGSESVDWEDINPKVHESMMYFLRKIATKSSLLGNSKLWWTLFSKAHRGLIGNASRVFSSYETIRTDRLHGMILAQLVERPCERLDNSYGKLIRYAQKWLSVKEEH